MPVCTQSSEEVLHPDFGTFCRAGKGLNAPVLINADLDLALDLTQSSRGKAASNKVSAFFVKTCVVPTSQLSPHSSRSPRSQSLRVTPLQGHGGASKVPGKQIPQLLSLSSIKCCQLPITGHTIPQHNPTSTTMEASGGNATLPVPGSTTTIPGCDAPFSPPSVFGLLLTLAFCLLTQPQGTLLYPSHLKPPRLATALLRLFPPCCVVETAVIIIYLIRSPCYAWREGHRPKLQVISTNKWYQTRLSLNLRPFTSQIQMTAVALLSVRSKKQATLLATLRAQTPSQEVELATIPHHTTRHGQATATGTDPTSGTLPRRRTTNLEDGVTLGTSKAAQDETIISTAGPDVLAHSEILVDVVTFLSVLAAMAKLAFSTLPLQVRFTAWPLVAGWMALHAVLLIFHSGGEDGINSLEPGALIREVRMIEAELNGPTAHRGLVVSSFFGLLSCGLYISQIANERFGPEELISAQIGEFWVVYFAFHLASIVSVILYFFVSESDLWIPPPFEVGSWRGIAVKGVSLMLFSASGAAVPAAYIWRSQADAWWTERIVLFMGGLLSGALALFLSQLAYGVSLFGPVGCLHLWGKIVIMAPVFVVLLIVLNNVEDTCKPGWLDYLG